MQLGDNGGLSGTAGDSWRQLGTTGDGWLKDNQELMGMG